MKELIIEWLEGCTEEQLGVIVAFLRALLKK